MNRNLIILFAVITLVIGLGLILGKLNTNREFRIQKFDESTTEETSKILNSKNIKIGDKNYEIFVTETLEDKRQGLSIFEEINENQGMLFEFPEENYHSFWMKDMKFDIDIIFLDKDKKVIQIFENVQKDSYVNEKNYKSYMPKLKSKYVIEIRSGESKKNRIKPGDAIIF
jgi:uncharacterized membrane protein (UPF0127 family)